MKEAIKKIGLAVFFIASLIIPQYADEFKQMEADPIFWQTATFIITAVLAWIDKTPEQVINKMTKKNDK